MPMRRLDYLIKAAWHVIHSDLDYGAIYQWRKQAADFLDVHLGPNHFYTQSFKRNIEEIEQRNLLTASGILIAAKEEITRNSERYEEGSRFSARQIAQ